jgi:hypothetical protein
MRRPITYFFDIDGNRLGTTDEDYGILPIPLYKGMQVTIHGHKKIFEVVDWNYHHGHSDEYDGLRIILKEVGIPDSGFNTKITFKHQNISFDFKLE